MAGTEDSQLTGVKITMEKKKKRSDTGYHDLKPTIWIGKQGITDTIVSEIVCQIKIRKVIKIKWLSSVELDPASVAEASRTKLLQVRGRTMVLGDSQIFR